MTKIDDRVRSVIAAHRKFLGISFQESPIYQPVSFLGGGIELATQIQQNSDTQIGGLSFRYEVVFCRSPYYSRCLLAGRITDLDKDFFRGEIEPGVCLADSQTISARPAD